MRKILLAALLCALSPSAFAQEAKPFNVLFQPKNIFHSGLRNTHTVALTFDDGPNAATLGVLDALKEEKIKATFFIVGRMARLHPDALARVAAEGHLLGNHSATHAQLTSRYDANPSALLEQLRGTDRYIAPLMQKGDVAYFRAPYGAWRSGHAAILNADPVLRRYVGPIYWDVGGDTAINKDGYILSSADWNCWKRGWTPETCAKGYLREIRRKNGGVVLMHSVNGKAAALVRAIVPVLQEEGYRFVRLDQVPAYDQYRTPDDAGAGAVASLPDFSSGLRSVSLELK